MKPPASYNFWFNKLTGKIQSNIHVYLRISRVLSEIIITSFNTITTIRIMKIFSNLLIDGQIPGPWSKKS